VGGLFGYSSENSMSSLKVPVERGGGGGGGGRRRREEEEEEVIIIYVCRKHTTARSTR